MRWLALVLVVAVLAVLYFAFGHDRSARTDAPAVPAQADAPATPAPKAEPAAPETKPAEKQDPRFVHVPEHPDATLRVRVTDGEGRPCAGAMVTPGLVVDDVGTSGPEEPANAEGLVDLAVEAHQVRGVSARVGSLTRWRPVTLAKGETKEVGIVVPAGGRITGEIRHPTDGPVADVTVTANRSSPTSGDFLRTTTDEAGRFVLEPVRAGTHKLNLYARKYGHPLNEYVEVRHDGAETIDIGTVFIGGAELAGTVCDAADGRPLPGVKVKIHDPIYAGTVTDGAGHYAFRNLTASAYDVQFRKPGYGPRYLRDVEIEAGAAKPVDVELTRGAVLDVYVRDTEDRPVAGPVGLTVRPGGGGNLDLDDEGHARYADLPPGRYALSIRRNDLDSASDSVEIGPGENTVRLRVQRRPYTLGKGVRSVHGTVRNVRTGKPVPGVRIGGPRGEVFTDADGAYVLHDLPVGEHWVHLTREGFGGGSERISVASAEAEVARDFTLEPAATLVLMLKDGDGRPVAGEVELIYVYRVDGNKRGGGGYPQADESGRAVFRRLVPGRYKLVISVPGIGYAETHVDIAAGDNEVDIVLGTAETQKRRK